MEWHDYLDDGLGTHIMADMYNLQNIPDNTSLEKIILQAVEASDAILVKPIRTFYDESKLIGEAIVAESHIIANVYPKTRYASIDIFLCGKTKPHHGLTVFQKELKPITVNIYEFKRGTNNSVKTRSSLQNKNYGTELIVDLGNCDYDTITSPDKLKEFIFQLCDLIHMKRYGNPIIERFGFGKDYTVGYSFTQLIETSLISGHFSEKRKSAHINIFSCEKFDEVTAANYCMKFFNAKFMNYVIYPRYDIVISNTKK